jgi:hypothetical protein
MIPYAANPPTYKISCTIFLVALDLSTTAPPFNVRLCLAKFMRSKESRSIIKKPRYINGQLPSYNDLPGIKARWELLYQDQGPDLSGSLDFRIQKIIYVGEHWPPISIGARYYERLEPIIINLD